MNGLKVVLGFVAAIVLFVAYIELYKEPHARATAKAFCASVHVGDSIDGLVERALAEGAETVPTRWRPPLDSSRPTDEHLLIAVFTGMPPFSRYICNVKATTRVIDAQYYYLD